MYEYRAVVERVIDGDSFVVDVDLGFNIHVRETLRLLGVDTPETWRPRNEAERAHGEQAKAFAKKWLEGRRVLLRTHDAGKGKYGRWLAEVVTPEGNDFGAMLREADLVKRDEY